ncbi:hypothetical protein INR49_010054 [Caranx melampygus]|nr:hypothetical protein INR49_010054 [Caranx melampygus]
MDWLLWGGGGLGGRSRSVAPAEAYGNDLISSVDPKFLKLTKLDDKIYSSFRETFKELDIKLLKADDLKSEQAKEVSDTQRVTDVLLQMWLLLHLSVVMMMMR